MSYIAKHDKSEDRVKSALDTFYNCAADRAHIEDRWFKNEKLLLGYIDPATWPYSARIPANLVWDNTYDEWANLYQGTLGINPPFQVLPFDKNDRETADQVRKMMIWQWHSMNGFYANFYTEWNRMLLLGLIYGYSPWYMDWERSFGYMPIREDTGPGPLKGNRQVMKNSPLYIGTRFRSMPPYHLYCKGGFSRFYESPFYYRWLLMDYDDLEKLGKAGRLQNVEKVKKRGGSGGAFQTTDYDQRINDVMKRFYTNYRWSEFNKNSDIECIEGWFPYENRRILIGAGDIELSLPDARIPFANGEVPFGIFDNYFSPWDSIGFSTPELIEPLEMEASFTKCARIDTMNRQALPQFMRLRAAKIFDEQVDGWVPFGVIDTNIKGGFEQLQIQDTWSQQSHLHEAKIEREAENRLGIAGIKHGVQPVSRETGYSVAQRSQANTARFAHKLQMVLQVLTIALGKQNRFNRQFLDPSILERLIPGGIKNFYTKDPMEVMMDYDYYCVPTASFGNRALRKEDWIKLVSLFASVPQFAATTKFAWLERQILEEFDVRDIDNIVDESDEAQERAMAMQQQGASPAAPGRMGAGMGPGVPGGQG